MFINTRNQSLVCGGSQNTTDDLWFLELSAYTAHPRHSGGLRS
jgi:hypothetical protein